MGVPSTSNPITNIVLSMLDLDVPLVPLESIYGWLKRKKSRISHRQYRQTLWKLEQKGCLKISKDKNIEFISLTRKGQLKILLGKSSLVYKKIWDKKWRLLIFDIPEASHLQRDHFRLLLKQKGFIKLQASVFISPYQLNAQAIRYLEETGLNKFIRILRVDKIDNDIELRKHFSL